MYAKFEELCVLLKWLVPEWDLICMKYNSASSKIVKSNISSEDSIPQEIVRNTIRVYST